MNDNELIRYARHILLPEVDVAGQEAICRGRVLIVGLGGLGSPVALYLAAAGVGHLVLVDHDEVELSNLQRQILHRETSLGLSKVESARTSLHEVNGKTALATVNERLDESNAGALVEQVDVVVDCSDNATTRQTLNRICRRYSRPLVFAAAIRFEGQIAVFDFRHAHSPCYQCVYGLLGESSQSCSENGIFSPVVGVIGAMQALETLKLLSGAGTALSERLGLFDGLRNEWRYIRFSRDPDCQVCSKPA